MTRHVHILGISGTFMSSIALLARELGYIVTGCDAQCYPPISDLLTTKGVSWEEGYELSQAALDADEIIVGNVVKRGMPVIEALLNLNKVLWSGPQWLAQNVLPSHRVISICGTHGKTTTTAMVTHILEQAGLNPGFLIGGVDNNLHTSARLGEGEWFVIEADEYDSAFFDKRPKLMHYRPDIAILNNIEFDHGDIYRDLADIQRQFQYYLRTIPSNSLLLTPQEDDGINTILRQGRFCEQAFTSLNACDDWQAKLGDPSGQTFEVYFNGQLKMQVNWSVIGAFNVHNALMAIAACDRVGVAPDLMAQALSTFKPVKRRLQHLGGINGIDIFDDFAHHPTAIDKTLKAVRSLNKHKRIIAVVELGSNTMKQGGHGQNLSQALAQADVALCYSQDPLRDSNLIIFDDTDTLLAQLLKTASPQDAIIFMSNKGFGQTQIRFKDRLLQVQSL